MMSAPFAGPPLLPFKHGQRRPSKARDSIHDDPGRPEASAQTLSLYYSTREARQHVEMSAGRSRFHARVLSPQECGLEAEPPFPLKSWTASELEKMPTYYIMDLKEGMAGTVAKEMPARPRSWRNKWLPDNELAVYAQEYGRNGFQGGLQWYRCNTSGATARSCGFSPAARSTYVMLHRGQERLGNLPASRRHMIKMQKDAVTNMLGCHLVEGAGHWVQQEQPEK